MATTYTPITSLNTQVEDSSAGQAAAEAARVNIPSNTFRQFLDSVEGASNFYSDYTTKITGIGDYEKIASLDVLVLSIRNLLITPRGSYPFDPEYGSDLYKKVFDPADSITAAEIREEVVTRIQQYDPRIEIESVETEFFTNMKGYRLSIFIKKDSDMRLTRFEFNDESAFALEEG